MQRILIIILIILLSHCSFDNKSGIWQNEQNLSKKDERFKDFKKFYTQLESYNKIKKPSNSLKIEIAASISNSIWPDEYYKNSNNLDNFNYKNNNEIIFMSKKITRFKNNGKILFGFKKTIMSDQKGNIYVYSIEEKDILFKFNFYKKQYKKIKKNIKISLDKNTIYAADNLGYLYAININSGDLLWAHNFKVPFRSNIKITEDKILMADINNNLIFINKIDGKKLKIVPTEDVVLKNNFINSIAHNNNSIIYLNTFGSIYSYSEEGTLNWFINISQALDDKTTLFYSEPLLLHKKSIYVATDFFLYKINLDTGRILFRIAITSKIKPIISGKNIFLITKDNLLVCINKDQGNVLYSVNINQEIADYLETKKKEIYIKSLALINNDLYIFLKNSYLVKFKATGVIRNIVKLPTKINSNPIFINDSIIYLNKKNKLVVLN